MFNIPVKEIIVNGDEQVRLLEDDGTPYVAADATPSAGGFILEGFLSLISGSALQLLKAATRIIKTTPSAGVSEVVSYVLTGATVAADVVFRVVEESLDNTPTLFQGQPIEKRYQIGAAQTTIDGVGAAIASAINGDVNRTVNATYTAGTDTLALTAIRKGTKIRLYCNSGYTLPAVTVTTPGALAMNTYDYLKNINWSKDVDIDRNLNYFPLPGVSYNSFYFEVNGTVQDTVGSNPIPSEKHNTVKYGVKIWVKDGLTLEGALDALVTDMNV
jgi:hypothetical protein